MLATWKSRNWRGGCGGKRITVLSAGTEIPVEYLSQASQIKLECLKLLSFIIRAATLAKFEEGMM